MSKTIEGLSEKFLKWKEAVESKGPKAYLGFPMVMVSGGITKHGMCKSKVGTCSCGVCSLRAKTNSALCLECGKWIHGICAGVKRLTPKLRRYFTYKKCEWNIGEAVEQEEKLCDVREFTYVGDRVRAGGRCEDAVIARTRCWWVDIKECWEFLHSRRFPQNKKWAAYKIFVRPAILYGREAWYQKENEMGIL